MAKMRTTAFSYLALVLFSLFGFVDCRGRSKDRAAHESLAVKGILDLKVRDIESHRGAVITVVISSASPVRLWRSDNSWGAARWRVFRNRQGKLATFYQNPNQGFTRNVPAFDTIGGTITSEQILDLNGGNWCWLDECTPFDQKGISGKTVTFEAGDFLIVVYDVPLDDLSLDKRVWYGVAATSVTVM